MSNSGRSRNNIDTRLIGFPPPTEFTPHRDAGMRGGNDIAILRQFGAYTESIGIGPFLCAEHVRQLGGVSPLHNLMEVKC